MAHRRLIIRERITAIIGSVILFGLVLLSYWYSIQQDLAGLRYVPSENSPDFIANDVTLTDFDREGKPTRRAHAANLKHFSDERMHADQARFVSLDPDQAPAVAVADEVWSNDGMETVELSGNVDVTRAAFEGEPDLNFRSEYVKGWIDLGRFETDRPVFLRRGTDTTEAEGGMMYDNVARTVELRSQVHSVLHAENFQTPGQPSTGTTSEGEQEQ
ncbi:LPS export ABC transporter periplasmic protein LptC [Sutterella sp.]|uniref:LPS export ABC transporter periplasmic protein LptC n=1 Tax=Sutterella sp. TaxID=1981025 RepID=UPI0026E04488|nr:LPS export ABC transporter periplasmic protein LptC [Sutterella sp.]MDO5530704.1 LPS export ABC transporter periplasmic protein LptC [Sutterella sp.]